MKNLDWDALRAGGGVALVFAIPFNDTTNAFKAYRTAPARRRC